MSAKRISIGRFFVGFLLVLFLFYQTGALGNSADSPSNHYSLVWPVESSRVLSATFGEYRPGHEHTGLDVAFQGRYGLPIRAVAEGVVVHLQASRENYGNRITLRHPDGTKSVYAHLEGFVPLLQSLIQEEQSRTGSYEVQLVPPRPICFDAGEVIAYGGASGTSAPHLHFEMIDSKGRFIDPLPLFLHELEDHRPPVLESILIEPIGAESLIAGEPWPILLTSFEDRPIMIPASGRLRLSIRAYDLQESEESRLGLKGFSLSLEGGKGAGASSNLLYRYRAGHLSGWDSDRAGITYRLEGTGLGPTRYTYRAYREEGMPSRFYRSAESSPDEFGSGLIDLSALSEGESIKLLFRLWDAFGNERELPLWFSASRRDDSLSPSARRVDGTLQTTPEAEWEIDLRARTLRLRLRPLHSSRKESGPAFLTLLDDEGRAVRGGDLFPLAYQSGLYSGSIELSDLRAGRYRIRARLSDQEYHLDLPLFPLRPGRPSRLEQNYSNEGIRIIAEVESALYSEVGSILPVAVENSRPLTAALKDQALEMLLPPHRFLPEGTPVADNLNVSFSIPSERVGDLSLGVYAWEPEERRWRFAGKEWRRANLCASVRSFGLFAVMADHAPPRARILSPMAGEALRGDSIQITVAFSDKASGIDRNRAQVLLDGEPVSGYFDHYKGIYFVDPLSRPLSSGRHRIEASVLDRAGNSSGVVELEFFVR